MFPFSRPCSRVPLARSSSEIKAVYFSPLLFLALGKSSFSSPRAAEQTLWEFLGLSQPSLAV